ncbi:MAG TPA: hypothetical protein VK646_05480 [Actinomycetota bacterium]|nr:hypothetical protein [Actinomycetota bacterium]
MPLSDRDRRTLIIGGVIVGVLLVGLLLFTLLSGGGGGSEALPSFPPPGSPQPTTAPTTAPSPVHPVAVFTGRDPFSKPGAFATTSSSSGSPTGSPSGSGTGTGTPTGSGTGTGTPTQPGNGSSETVGGHQIVLLDTFQANGQTRAQVEIDGTAYNVAVGETFGPGDRYELRSVSGDCATFLFGDESFTLCITPQK